MPTKLPPVDKAVAINGSPVDNPGIHGRPYTTWPNQAWNKNKITEADAARKDKFQWRGFCTHSSILFLPWHRPYLALFETELRRHVQAAAEEYTVEEGQNGYRQAAKTFRLPYWDWALPADKDNGVFPFEALTDTKHYIVFPMSRAIKQFATNPLASYKFGNLGIKDKNINPFDKVNATIRWPVPGDATSNEAGLRNKLLSFLEKSEVPGSAPNNDAFYKKGKNLTERVLYLLQSYDLFGPISSNYFFNQQDAQKFANWCSLEDIHNAIHSYVEMRGHMGDPAIAAFDPIFWLHHANIDRLYAIWQAIWDKGAVDQYVTPEAAQQDEEGSGGTFSTPRQETDTIDTELTPFTRSEDGKMWTSRDVRSTRTFGYVYPETQTWLHSTKDDILSQLKSIYPNASFDNNIKTDKDKRIAATEALKSRANTILALETAPLKTAALVQVASANVSDAQKSLAVAAQQVEVPPERTLADLVEGDKYLEWLVDVRAEKHALGGDFVVHIFLGTPDDENSFLYIADPNHVAIFSTFGTDENTGCENCKKGQEASLKVTGQIPLTLALVERYLAGKLDSITPQHVVQYLQTHLHWRVTDQSETRGSRADVSGLLVSVVSNEVTLPESPAALPQYAPHMTPWPAATTRENSTEGRGRGTGYTEG